MPPDLTKWLLGLFVAAICALWIRLEAVNRRSQRKHDECEQDRQKLTAKQEKLTRIVVSSKFCRARECMIREMAIELDAAETRNRPTNENPRYHRKTQQA